MERGEESALFGVIVGVVKDGGVLLKQKTQCKNTRFKTNCSKTNFPVCELFFDQFDTRPLSSSEEDFNFTDFNLLLPKLRV
jgi:hypothetical protein